MLIQLPLQTSRHGVVLDGGRPRAGKFPFFVGLHRPKDAEHFRRCCISIHVLWNFKHAVQCDEVMVDSGAFTELEKHGCYPESPDAYAAHLYRLWNSGIKIVIAWSQDYMCESFMLEKTGLTVLEHQRLTIERYDAIKAELERLFNGVVPFAFGPIIQGFTAEEYLRHVAMYGDRLTKGMWVGVGSVCKRNGSPGAIACILSEVLKIRPDLRLHGFGVKLTSLKDFRVRSRLFSADSMAWSAAARFVAARMWGALNRAFQPRRKKIKQRVARRYYRRIGQHMPNPNDWREAKIFEEQIMNEPLDPNKNQICLFGGKL